MKGEAKRPILTNMEDLHNFLVSQLKTERCIITFFVGAGISIPPPSYMPSADDIITQVIESLCIDPETKIYQRNLSKRVIEVGMKMEVLFDIIQHNVGSKLNTLFSIFNEGEPNEYHYFLARSLELDLIKHIITTNFDQLIERASREDLNVFTTDSEHTNRHNRSIFKIHGTIDRPETIIAVLPQVSKGLGTNKYQLLKETLKNTCVVIGWSDNDIDLTPPFLEVENENLIWFHYAPNLKQVADFKAKSDWEGIQDSQLKNIQKILKKSGGVLVACDPMPFFLSVWHSLQKELGSIPTLKSSDHLKFASITLLWGKSLTITDRLIIVGDILRHINSWDEAICLYQKVESEVKTPHDLARVHCALGICANNMHKWEDAFHYFQLSLKDKGYDYSIETLLKKLPEDPELAPLYGNIGNMLKRIGRFEDAAKCLKMDFTLCKRSNIKGQCEAYINYANSLSLKGQFEEAEAMINKGIRLGIQEGNIKAQYNGCRILADIALLKGNFNDAEHQLRVALRIAGDISRPDYQVDTLNDFAKNCGSKGALEKAQKYADEALEIAKYYDLHFLQAQVLVTKGVIEKEKAAQDKLEYNLSDSSHFDFSLEFYNKALNIVNTIQSNDRLKSTILDNRGLLYFLMGEHQKAIRDLEESLQLRTQIMDKLGRATILDNLSLVCCAGGMVDRAEAYLAEALSIYKQFNYKIGQCQVLNDLGGVFLTRLLMGNKMNPTPPSTMKIYYQNAKKYLKQSLELANELRIPNKITQAKLNLEKLKRYYQEESLTSDKYATVSNKTNIEEASLWIQEAIAYRIRGNLDDAQILLEKAIKVARGEGDEKTLATAMSELGQVYIFKQDFMKAMQYVEKSVVIRTRLNDFRGLSVDYQLMGNLMKAVGLFDEAETYFRDSLGLALGLKDDTLVASAESNLGLIFFNRNKFSEAKIHFQNSQKIRKRLGDRLGMAKNLNHLGRIEEDMENFKEAKKYYQKSLSILRIIGAPEIDIALGGCPRIASLDDF